MLDWRSILIGEYQENRRYGSQCCLCCLLGDCLKNNVIVMLTVLKILEMEKLVQKGVLLEVMDRQVVEQILPEKVVNSSSSGNTGTKCGPCGSNGCVGESSRDPSRAEIVEDRISTENLEIIKDCLVDDRKLDQ